MSNQSLNLVTATKRKKRKNESKYKQKMLPVFDV